jgi:hypothetical protein
VVTERPAWREVQLRAARELGEPVHNARPLVPARRSGMTWAARAQRTGAIVVKIRHGERAGEKTQWCAAHLPALGARGYPVPAILWHCMISAQWHMSVQSRLPGRALFALDCALDGLLLDALLGPVKLQADAALDLLASHALALDCERRGDHAAADRLLARVARVAGTDGLRCLVSYRAIGRLAFYTHERQAYGNSLGDADAAMITAGGYKFKTIVALPYHDWAESLE